MIYIDDRIGSKELVDLIDGAILVSLEFGDVMFGGNGPEGDVEIGIERKRIGDLVTSMMSGRLSGHQLPGLLDSYYKVYLIVEGTLREGDTGELEVWRGRGRWVHLDRGGRKFAHRDIWTYLTTLEMMTGITVRTSLNASDTALKIQYLHHWWSKPWEKHRGHLQFHKPLPPSASFNFERPSTLMKILSEIPGLGWQRAEAVAKEFKTVRKMFEASQDEWEQVEGIGKTIARSAWRILHEG